MSDERWNPDDQLVPALLAGSGRVLDDLSPPDRCWAIAGLGLAGLTAEDIADRLHCSLRTIRSIRAMDMTQVAFHMQRETEAFGDELRLVRSELGHRDRELAEMTRDRDRTKDKLDRLLDAHITGVRSCGRCGTPLDRWNAYEHSGKKHCRKCHRDRLQERRDAARAGLSVDEFRRAKAVVYELSPPA